MSRGSDHAPFRDNLSSLGWDLAVINKHTKFEVSSLSRSKDIFG